MPTARLLGKGKKQKLVIDEITEPGKVEVTRQDNDELTIEFYPKGKNPNGTPPQTSASNERTGFFDKLQPIIGSENSDSNDE